MKKMLTVGLLLLVVAGYVITGQNIRNGNEPFDGIAAGLVPTSSAAVFQNAR